MLWESGQCSDECGLESLHDLPELVLEEGFKIVGWFRVEPRAEAHEALTLARNPREFHCRGEQCEQHCFDAEVSVRRFLLELVEQRQPLPVHGPDAPREGGLDHRFLGAEVIVNRSEIDLRLLGERPQGYALDAMRAEQRFGGVENLLLGVGGSGHILKQTFDLSIRLERSPVKPRRGRRTLRYSMTTQ